VLKVSWLVVWRARRMDLMLVDKMVSWLVVLMAAWMVLKTVE
jgi:hypothetical protein